MVKAHRLYDQIMQSNGGYGEDVVGLAAREEGLESGEGLHQVE